MKVRKVLDYTREKIDNYAKIDAMIKKLEISKETSNPKDVNSFIRSKNKVNRAVEGQAIKNINIEEKIENLKKWKDIIDEELEYLKNNNLFEYKIIFFRLTGNTYDDIIEETGVSQRILVRILNEFLVEITLIAIKNNLIEY